ncbi:MAG: hypothetical protein EOP23_00905 [Hyphomicrobiales bacterium]|nr:MAG: hypothetical protein EOP23_00905 [Hyphomicrobiales bacterium]
MFRAAILAAATAVVLGGGALMATSPAAAPVAVALGQAAQAGQGLVAPVQYDGPRRPHRARPFYRHRPRCFWSDRRVWDGWRWVVRPVRVCR